MTGCHQLRQWLDMSWSVEYKRHLCRPIKIMNKVQVCSITDDTNQLDLVTNYIVVIARLGVLCLIYSHKPKGA